MKLVFTRKVWLLVLGLVLAGRFFFFQEETYPVGKKIKLTGIILEEPYLKGSKQVIPFGEIVIFTEVFPIFEYAQRIEVIGTLEPSLTENKKLKYGLYYPKISILKNEESMPFWVRARRKIIDFREGLELVLERALPEPHASLLSGIIFGVRANIPAEFLQKLEKTGTIHIMAASGFNISVVAGFLISFFVWFFKRRVALLFSFLGILVYTLMAGASPAVVRAAIMGGLTYLAQFLGREREAVWALVLTAWVMIFFNPLIVFEIGFQLSLAATAGILFVLPLWEKWRFFGENLMGKEVGLTLAAQIGVLPIILYHFGSIDLFSPVVNGLIGPMVPYLMSFGAVTAAGGLVGEGLGRLISWPAWVMLEAMRRLVEFFGGIEWSSFDFSLPRGGVVVYYLVLALVLRKLRLKDA